MAKRKSGAPARLLVSVLLSAVTVAFIGFSATRLAYNELFSEVATYAQEPGMAVARMFNPTPPPWGILFVGCSMGVYALAWFIILTMVWQTRSGAIRPHT
jgi:hypothetical protein